MEVRLVVLLGEHQGREIPLPETIFLIGRNRQCHLRPHCREVSGLHCAIAAWAGKVRVRDLKSRNGTLLNGQPIQGEVEAHDGDELRIGTLVFAFRIKDERRSITAEPIRDETVVQWLLDVPANGKRVSPMQVASAIIGDGPSEEDDPLSGETASRRHSAPESAVPKSNQGISAGQSFHDYFAQRKRRR